MSATTKVFRSCVSRPCLSPPWRLARALGSSLLVVALLVAGAGAALARGGDDDDDDTGGGHGTLKLRLNDAVGKPGGTVALVVRTYAARPIRQGRITVKVRRPGKTTLGLSAAELAAPPRPVTFVRAVVFSRDGDAVVTARSVGADPSVRVTFSSKTAGVNAVDGPLAVIFLRLAPGVAPGDTFLVQVDPALTGLTDPAGQPIAFEPIEAELRVRAPSAPFDVEAEGAKVEPGEVAELGVETIEPFPVGGGRLTLRFDPAAAGGAPRVAMDPRYGKATYTVDASVPGRLVVDFRSSDASLNRVPGRILAVDLPTAAGAPVGWESPVTLDPAGSWLLAAKGNRRLAIRIENGALEFR